VRKEIVIAGSGGQGIQRLGRILARALDSKGLLISLESSYGAEARGGNSFSHVVVKESLEDWPGILTVDVLVAMSQEGYNAWINKTSWQSKVFFDAGSVRTTAPPRGSQYPVPVTKVADELGLRVAANMVMLGAVAAVTRFLSLEELREVIKKEAGKFSDVNLKALKEGYKLGKLIVIPT